MPSISTLYQFKLLSLQHITRRATQLSLLPSLLPSSFVPLVLLSLDWQEIATDENTPWLLT